LDQAYIPIDCSRHDELLALATLRRPCSLQAAFPDGSTADLTGVIADVYTEAGAEYLRLSSGPIVRLDWIRSLSGRPFP
jgi:Rho-binding antiterminator